MFQQRNRASLDLSKSKMMVSNSYNCQDFYRHILDENALLEVAKSTKTAYKFKMNLVKMHIIFV